MSGYICKQCGGPAPMGVGYASTEGAAEMSSLKECACGYSVTITKEEK